MPEKNWWRGNLFDRHLTTRTRILFSGVWGILDRGRVMCDGDDLYTDSTLALDADKWSNTVALPVHPHDLWITMGSNEAVLVDIDRQGHRVKGWINANRKRLFLPAGPHQVPRFIYGEPFASPTTFTGLDPKTGRPNG